MEGIDTRFVSEDAVETLMHRGFEKIEQDGIDVLISPDIRLEDDAELMMRSFLGIKFFETRGIIPLHRSCSISY